MENENENVFHDALTEEAQEAVPRSVEIHDMSDVTATDFEYPDELDALDVAVRRCEKIVSFEHPTQAGKKINFLVRALTPGENASVSGSLFSNETIQKVMLEVLTEKDIQGDEEELQRRVIEKLASQKEHELLTLDTDEKMLRTLQYGIIKPAGITVERMRSWNSEVINILYETITEEVTAKDAVWSFSGMGV